MGVGVGISTVRGEDGTLKETRGIRTVGDKMETQNVKDEEDGRRGEVRGVKSGPIRLNRSYMVTQ